MKILLRDLIILLVLAIVFILTLIWVSKVEPEPEEKTYEIHKYEYEQLVDEVPRYLFDDPEIVMEVNLATPCQAIEEREKGLALIESRKPRMKSIGVYELTAYAWTGNPCANGNFPTCGYTVACNSLPMGTRIYIEGYGNYVVEDRGGMSSNVIDIYMGDTGTCIQFGRRTANVYVLE